MSTQRLRRRRPQGLLLALAVVLCLGAAPLAGAQVILRPAPGATVTLPTYEPPFRLTVRVYVTGLDGAVVLPGRGVRLRLTDPGGRHIGYDPDSGAYAADLPGASYDAIVVNPQPTAPIGPRGLGGVGIALDDPPDGRYLLEITGLDRVRFEIAVEQWDRAGRRASLHYSTGATEPNAVDRYEVTYTAAARPSIDVAERREQSYLLVRAYGRPPQSHEPVDVAELLLNDPRRRRLGLDPRAKHAYAEIPRATYGDTPGDIPGKELELAAPADGRYTLQVTGTRAGRYDLSLYGVDREGEVNTTIDAVELPIAAGVVHRFAFDYASAPSSRRYTLSGAYAQGDRLISYAYPTGPRLEIPAGQAMVPLILFYAPGITMESLRATLDGRDVTAEFHPVPGEADVVMLGVARGTHALVVALRGMLPDGRSVSHTDRFDVVRR